MKNLWKWCELLNKTTNPGQNDHHRKYLAQDIYKPFAMKLLSTEDVKLWKWWTTIQDPMIKMIATENLWQEIYKINLGQYDSQRKSLVWLVIYICYIYLQDIIGSDLLNHCHQQIAIYWRWLMGISKDVMEMMNHYPKSLNLYQKYISNKRSGERLSFLPDTWSINMGSPSRQHKLLSTEDDLCYGCAERSHYNWVATGVYLTRYTRDDEWLVGSRHY